MPPITLGILIRAPKVPIFGTPKMAKMTPCPMAVPIWTDVNTRHHPLSSSHAVADFSWRASDVIFGEHLMWSPDTFAAPCDRPIIARLQSVQSDDTPSWWHRWSRRRWWWGAGCGASCNPPKPVLWVRSPYQVHWMAQTESNCNGLQRVWLCICSNRLTHCTMQDWSFVQGKHWLATSFFKLYLLW